MAKKKTRAKRLSKKNAQKRTARKGKVSARERTRPVVKSRVTKKKAARRKRGVSARASAGIAAKLRKRAAAAMALAKAARALQGRRIVVAFADNLNVPQTRGFKDKKGDWATLRRMGAKSLAPIFTNVDMVNRLEEESRKVREDVPRYRNSFMLELERSSDTKAVLKVLRSWRDEVRLAYEDREPVLATGGPSAALCNVGSGHLAAAPEGVHASAAWALQGGQGEGQVCVDVEKAWATHHRLAHPARVQQLCGGIVSSGCAHGTMVLGILCGSRNLGGCEGIAPEIAEIQLASHAPGTFGNLVVRPDRANTPQVENVYDAVAHAIDHLTAVQPVVAGSIRGVLLIEYQTPDKGLPIEILPLMKGLLRSARNVNVCVVEAAGNGARNLDQEPDIVGGTTFPLRRAHGGGDSGAIVVGSSSAAFPPNPVTGVHEHARFPTSNFGGRVDCYAWGEQIRAPTLIAGPPPTPTECEDFGETSGAAAIIAGVALQILGIAAADGVRLDVQAVRKILSDPALGTPAPPGSGIGSMPDLKKILLRS